MDRDVSIRVAAVEDAEKILAIYRPYVEKTAITFEYAVPCAEEFSERIERTLSKYPYLVAQKDGEILGYAYTGPFEMCIRDSFPRCPYGSAHSP